MVLPPIDVRESIPDMTGFAVTIPYQETYMTCRDSIFSRILSHLTRFATNRVHCRHSTQERFFLGARDSMFFHSSVAHRLLQKC